MKSLDTVSFGWYQKALCATSIRVFHLGVDFTLVFTRGRRALLSRAHDIRIEERQRNAGDPGRRSGFAS